MLCSVSIYHTFLNAIRIIYSKGIKRLSRILLCHKLNMKLEIIINLLWKSNKLGCLMLWFIKLHSKSSGSILETLKSVFMSKPIVTFIFHVSILWHWEFSPSTLNLPRICNIENIVPLLSVENEFSLSGLPSFYFS